MYSGFQSSCIVTDPRLLFGHNEPRGLLDQLLLQIQIGTNLQLLGEHRSGKTSVLKCCISRLQAENPELVPVYLNFRQHYYIRGAATALRLMLAHIHAAIVAQSRDVGETVRIRGASLTWSPHTEEHFDALAAVKQDYLVGEIFKDYVLEFIPKREIGVVLFLDEFEHMMLETFGAQKGAFFPVRDITSRSSPQKGGIKPCTYVLAGAMPWNRLCGIIGSPELNNITQIYYVEPLTASDFGKMWTQCVEDSSAPARDRIAEAKVDEKRAYELSGGWPFFGKAIGDQLSAGAYDEEAMYEAFLQHFQVSWAHLTLSERKILMSIAAKRSHADHVPNELIHRGVVRSDGAEARLVGLFWSRFVEEQLLLEQTERHEGSTDGQASLQRNNDVERYVFRREGDFWNIAYDGHGFHLKDMKGLHYIAYLFRYPEREVSVFELSSLDGRPLFTQHGGDGVFRITSSELADSGLRTSGLSDSGPMIDQKALKQYEKRLRELNDDLEIAKELHNRERMAEVTEEIAAIQRQIAFGTGLRGKIRKANDVHERNRKAVYNNYNRSLSSIEQNSQELWRHIKNGITSGDFFAYKPERLPPWKL